MTRTDYVFTLASYFGPVAQFFDRPELLAATARGYESRPGFAVLHVSACEVRAAWAEACAPGKHCERYARGLGGCIAGTCNPPRPTTGVRVWQHDETGRITETAECPGPRWNEVPRGAKPCPHCDAPPGSAHSSSCPPGVPAAFEPCGKCRNRERCEERGCMDKAMSAPAPGGRGTSNHQGEGR